MRKLMEVLGLVDGPEYEEEYGYDEVNLGPATGPVARPRTSEEVGSIRTLPRDVDGGGVGGITPIVRPVRTLSPVKDPKVTVVEALEFSDGQQIGEKLRNGQPVALSVINAPQEVGRRLVDFCSACVFMVEGRMKKVGRGVFLLLPANVDISENEKRRLQERGLYTLPD